MHLQQLAEKTVKGVLKKGMNVKNEDQILIYDRQSKLASILADAYIKFMPKAQVFHFDETEPKIMIDALSELESGSTVILVQSSNFRLDDFRIRLNLFNRGIGCLEHTHVGYIYEDQYETYLNAAAYRGDYYTQLGAWLKKKIDNCKGFSVESNDGSVITFGAMEDSKLNTGKYHVQKSRGGGAMCGELFSEAKDFSTVNGEMMIYCYPDEKLQIVQYEPFKLKVKESFITCDDPKCPEDFRKNILNRIEENENMGGVFMREAGFGLNPAITREKCLADVNAYERIAGFHVSLGMKHQVYRTKFGKDKIQRFHIDIFIDNKRIIIDDEVVFEDEKWLFRPSLFSQVFGRFL